VIRKIKEEKGGLRKVNEKFKDEIEDGLSVFTREMTLVALAKWEVVFRDKVRCRLEEKRKKLGLMEGLGRQGDCRRRVVVLGEGS